MIHTDDKVRVTDQVPLAQLRFVGETGEVLDVLDDGHALVNVYDRDRDEYVDVEFLVDHLTLASNPRRRRKTGKKQPMTNEEFAQRDGLVCPYCRHDRVGPALPRNDGDMECHKCHRKWREVLALVGYGEISEDDDE